jgi:EAL domain-containing protein (putative c-di-GMP-specific phosphodiesterase class I)
LELNKEIIAEGVETKEQLDFMKEYGCFVIQGYYFDKPLSYSDFEQRLINKEYNKD